MESTIWQPRTFLAFLDQPGVSKSIERASERRTNLPLETDYTDISVMVLEGWDELFDAIIGTKPGRVQINTS